VELEPSRLLIEDADTGDVAGQEVRGELDATAGGALDALRDGPRQRCLAGSGYVFQEQVSFTDQGREGQLDRAGLPHHDLFDVRDKATEHVGEPERLFRCHRHFPLIPRFKTFSPFCR